MADMPARALFLDFDGLICDTERAVRRSWDETYRELGLVFPPGVWEEIAGRADGEADALADLSRRLGGPVTDVLRARRLLRKQALSAAEPLRPGVAALIAEATRRGLTLAVVSSSPRTWVHEHLFRLGVLDRFAVIVCGDDVFRRKPAPDLYQLALRRTGLTADQVIAFEDSPPGVLAARAAGLQCVAVPSAASSAIGLSHATLVLDSLERYQLDAARPVTKGRPQHE
jgi:HAD superfamily hydrolase (TIGR01509 family)